MDDHAEIATERLILRPLAPEHAAALYEIHADPEAMRFWHAPPHKHLDETRAMVDELIGGPERVWVLCQRDGKEGIGLVYYLGNVGRPGMGYILHPGYWGKGLMSEAVRDGKLVIPISRTLPLSEAANAQAAAEKGGIGKILLVP